MFGFGKKEEKSFPLGLPGLTFPPGAELEHILIPATTGAGKSQLIHYLLDSILKGIEVRPESQRAIITDLNGQFAESRSHPHDQLVNPSDRRSLKWNPFREIKSEMDYRLLSTAAITTDGASGEEKNWRQFAQTMLESIMKGLDKEGNANPQRVLELIRPSDPELVRQYITGTPAESLLSGPNERFFGSVIGVLSNALAAW
ncbi:MAG: type IV secretion system DNA-binding domain-containing protein, partial [Leptospirales bacterium]